MKLGLYLAVVASLLKPRDAGHSGAATTIMNRVFPSINGVEKLFQDSRFLDAVMFESWFGNVVSDLHPVLNLDDMFMSSVVVGLASLHHLRGGFIIHQAEGLI